MKEPFNEELKELVASFADLLKPIVETVDRFGLKARFLGKHKKDEGRFFRALSRRSYKTEIALKVKSRFEKIGPLFLPFWIMMEFLGITIMRNMPSRLSLSFAGILVVCLQKGLSAII